MPKVAKGQRKRAYRPKTRSGCFTCKSKAQGDILETDTSPHLINRVVRRVKCDETRPECLRCTSTRRVCDGYAPVQRPDQSNSLAMTAVPSLDIHDCAQSRRSFAFFTQRTSPQLAGFFGSVFWERLVLQTAHHEPAIRHAIVAIGSLHEQKTVAGGFDVTFALEQYNLAIKKLLSPLSQAGARGVDVCLISCILFTCFEVRFHSDNDSMPCRRLIASHTLEYTRTSCIGRVSHPKRLQNIEGNCI